MRAIDGDALISDCQLAQKQADRHGREFANAFYSPGGEISTEWWCVEDMIENAPTIEPEPHWIPPERLTDDDFETIRIHLNAYKEKLCNQQRWEEANEYQRIIDRFMSFASAQPEQRLSCKNCIHLGHGYMMPCKNCKRNQMLPDWYEMETERKKND